jgi:hypothetical protein
MLFEWSSGEDLRKKTKSGQKKQQVAMFYHFDLVWPAVLTWFCHFLQFQIAERNQFQILPLFNLISLLTLNRHFNHFSI